MAFQLRAGGQGLATSALLTKAAPAAVASWRLSPGHRAFPQHLHSRNFITNSTALRAPCRRQLAHRRPSKLNVSAMYDGGETEGGGLSFFQRLVKAWQILFPPRQSQTSDADVARERLRLVLYTDRGEVSQDVRNKLRMHIIDAISAYVEIESEDEVQLVVAADPSLGTVYSVTIPVRRVKPEYQEYWSDSGFRDRFYEEILRERGDPLPDVTIKTTFLQPGDL